MIHLQLITLSGRQVDREVFELRVPTTAGTVAINAGHAPIVGAIAAGILSIYDDRNAEPEQMGVYTGTLEVLNDKITVLADEIDTPDEVIAQEAEAALKRAQELRAKAGDAVSIAEAQAMMDRQAVRLQLADLKKTSKRRY